MKLLFCSEAGCPPYHWPLFLGYPWLVTFRQRFSLCGRKKNVFETLCWWGGYEREQKKKQKRPGTGGVIVVKWKSSSGFRMGKAALRSQCCAALLVHFEGKNSWNGEFCLVSSFLDIFLFVMKSCISKTCYLSNSWHCSNPTPKGF